MKRLAIVDGYCYALFMKLSHILLSSIALSSSAPVFANNYMRCSDLGLFFGDCSLNQSTLREKTKSEREFSVRFRFFCPGHGVAIGFETEHGFHHLSSRPDAQELVMTGQSLTIIDKDQSGTERSTFDSNCELAIFESKVSLSKASRATLTSIDEEATIISDSVSAFKRAIIDFGSLRDSTASELRNLHWTRDHMRQMLHKIDVTLLPAAERTVFRLNLRMLDSMAKETSPLELARKLEETVVALLKTMQAQEKTLLDRVSELKLRAVELLTDVEQVEAPEWKSLFTKLDGVSEMLRQENLSPAE